MASYYEIRRASNSPSCSSSPPPPSSAVPSSPSANMSDSDSDEDLDAAYDCTRLALLAAAQDEDREEGWEEEFARYVKDFAKDATRDMDLVEWWSVSLLITIFFYNLLTTFYYRNMHISIPSSRSWRSTFSPLRHLPLRASGCFRPVDISPLIQDPDSTTMYSNNFSYSRPRGGKR